MTIDLTLYGVQDTGFVKLRTDEAIGDIFDTLETQWQVSLDRDPNSSFIAGLVFIIADRMATLYEVGEGVYNAMYPNTASGASLDQAVSFTGVTRLPEAYTTAYQTFFGAEQTLVPLGTQVQNSITGDAYQTTEALVITANACNFLELTPAELQNSTQYSLTINGTPYSYTTSSAASVTEIVNNLAAQAAKSGLAVQTQGATFVVSTAVETSFQTSFSSNLSAVSIGSPCNVAALVVGPLQADAGVLTDMGSTIGGLTGTVNNAAASPGRYAENDAELRARYPTGTFVLGAGSLDAIYAQMANLNGVTNVRVIANTSGQTDSNGIPDKNVAVILQGGNDQAIAETLFSVVAGGIPTYGKTTVGIKDAQGTSQQVSFTRPVPVYVWLNIAITLNQEEVFPVNGFGLISGASLAYGQTLLPGADVILQRFNGPIYEACAGIENITITAASSTDPTASPAASAFSTNNIPINAFQQAAFDTSRIEVTG